jgi:anti-sigma B factor antagonist
VKLNLRISRLQHAVIVRCSGRIVYRQEARALSRLAMQTLQDVELAVLELAEVSAIDSAGLGELVLLHMYAEGHGKTVKLAAVPPRVLELLELSNLTSVFEVCASVEEALGVTQAAQ